MPDAIVDEQLARRSHSYFEQLSRHPLPHGLEPGAPFPIRRQTDAPHRVVASVAVFALVASVIAFFVLAVGHFLSGRQPAATPTAFARVTPPPGGPVPDALNGDWHVITTNPGDQGDLIFNGSKFQIETTGGVSFGQVAVNGDEMDFYSGTGCGIALPGGVGRYRWNLSGGVLHLAPLGIDPCGGRERAIANSSYTKAGG